MRGLNLVSRVLLSADIHKTGSVSQVSHGQGARFVLVGVFAPLFRFLAKYVAERGKISTFIDSKLTVHLFVRKVTALSVVVIEKFTKVSRPSR